MSVDRIECGYCAAQNHVERTSCHNCGAQLDVRRTVAPTRSVLDLLGAAHGDTVKAFEQFVQKARTSWPSLVEVERDGLFARGAARRFVLRLPGRAYIARREGPGVVFEVGTLIRGALVRTRQVAAREWTEGLYSDLTSAGEDAAAGGGLPGAG